MSYRCHLDGHAALPTKGVGECYVYDIGGRVVWREDLPSTDPSNAVPPAVMAERDQNARKVDCAHQVKATLPAATRAKLVTTLGVKDSRVPWTLCDRLVEGVANDRITVQELREVQQGGADGTTLKQLLDVAKGNAPLSTQT